MFLIRVVWILYVTLLRSLMSLIIGLGLDLEVGLRRVDHWHLLGNDCHNVVNLVRIDLMHRYKWVLHDLIPVKMGL